MATPGLLRSAIRALKEKHGVVALAKKIGVTPVSLQAFLNGSETYAKTLAKMQKAAGVEVTAIPAKERLRLLAKEKSAKKAAKKAEKLAKKSAKVSSKVKTKKVRTKTKKRPKMKAKAAPPKRKAAKVKKTNGVKKKHKKSSKSKKHSVANGVTAPAKAVEETPEPAAAAAEG